MSNVHVQKLITLNVWVSELKIKKIEQRFLTYFFARRGFSTIHAVIVATTSLYLLVFSDLFKNDSKSELVVNRKSLLSDATLGVGIEYLFLFEKTL